ncbi:MAG: response regulator [Planctomycetaceae bacterium]|jgi:two-component system, LuxR family, response regulator FixJ|nr:response regulator [Planctomycetaceae bacterium]MBT6486707.1 response regulator [Planctomycetaceae bacterium]MBT6494062.1 response regulator [Planctomycetaceae bacterium]
MSSDPHRNATVFIVDDEAAIRDALSLVVRAMGISVHCFSSAHEFIEFLERHDVSSPACLITDIQMAKINGIVLLEQLIAMGWEFPVIMMTGHGDETLRQKAEVLGATYLEKPFRPSRLEEVIRANLKHSNGEKDT